MFMHNDQFCAVQTWFHDIPNGLTQATLYRYATEENYLEHNKELSSEIFRFNYSEELHSLVGVEAAVKIFVEQIEHSVDETPQEGV